jgi:abhydrolase domain-containing protein 14
MSRGFARKNAKSERAFTISPGGWVRRRTPILVLAALPLACGAEPAVAPNAAPGRLPELPELRAIELTVSGRRTRGLANSIESERGVLLLHGARFESRTWADLGTLADLETRGVRAVALDLPGYGGSESSDVAPDAFLAEALASLGFERVVLVLPSMSGCFGFPFAARAPAELAGAVWVAPACAEACPEGSELPSLILWGERDDVVPVAEAAELARKLVRSETRVFEGAGHACYLDDPAQFHALLAGFAERIL